MTKPFTEEDNLHPAKLSVTRITEAVIIGTIVAILSTAATAWVTLQTIGAKVEQLSNEVRGYAAKQESDRNAIAQLQVSTVSIQARLVEVQSATNQRLTLVERKVFNLP